MLCHALLKSSQAPIGVSLGLQCCWMFLLACHKHSNVAKVEKTTEIAFQRAWSQLLLIALGFKGLVNAKPKVG